jgi:hypothetical protein
MAKGDGLGVRLLVAGYDISGDIGSIERIAGGHAVNPNTGVDKFAVEREALLVDGGFDYTAFFNKAAGQAHLVLRDLPTADEQTMYLHKTTIGNPAAACVAKRIDYAGPKRAATGQMVFNISVVANGFGLEWGRQLTAGLRTDTGATNGTTVDFGQANAFGLQAYLQVTGFTGTDATVKLQMDDNSGFTTPTDVTGGGFAAITTAPQAQRIQTSRTFAVERYLRVTTTTSAGFSSLAFAVMVNVNTTSVVF